MWDFIHRLFFGAEPVNTAFFWAALPWIITGATTLAGALGGRAKKKWTQGYRNVTQDISETGTSKLEDLPILLPEYQRALGPLTNQIVNRLQEDPQALLESILTTAIQQRNIGANIEREALNQVLASRGLNYSPVAAAMMAGLESRRIGDIIRTRSQAPVIAEDIQQKRLAEAMNFLRTLPIGRRRTGEFSTRRQGTTREEYAGKEKWSGNVLGGAFTGLASALAMLYGMGVIPPVGAGAKGPQGITV